ncbi:MAG: DMT family transporter [Gemmatimonadaceae bacterium]
MTSFIEPAKARPPGGATGRATLLLLLAASGFGSIAIFIVVGTRSGATLVTLLAWRYILACALLTLVAEGPRALIAIPRRRIAELAGLGGGGQALVAFVSLSALRWTTAATLAFLFYTYPAWVAVIAALRRTEPIDRRRSLALGLSLGGILLMVGSPWAAPIHPVGAALGLASAVVYALYIPLIRRLSTDVPARVATVWIGVGAAMLFVTGGMVTGTFSAWLSPTAWGAAGGLALFSTVVAFIAFLRGLAVLGPVRTAIVSTVEPFWTAIAAAVLLGQRLSWTTLAGGLLIAVAVALLQSARVDPRPALTRAAPDA